MSKLTTLLVLPLLFCGGLLAQQQIFVLYDANCMLRLQYEQVIAQQPRMDYYAYQIPTPDGNKLILETGVEGSVRQNYLPPDYLACNDPRLAGDLADQVNGNRAKVFMLIPEGTDYLIQPVTMGAVLARQANLFTYVSPLASFQFDTRNVVIGDNLSFNNSNARVFFEGRDGNLCGGTYLIRQLMPRNAYPVIDYKINPEAGVIERRLGSDGNASVGGVTTLQKVNLTPLANYLATNCNGSPALAGGPVTYGSGVVPPTAYQPPTAYVAPTATPQVSQVIPTVPATTGTVTARAAAPVHTVAKGETLYGISRLYEVSVDQVKEWNNLGGNTITVGQNLRVGQTPVGSPAPTPAPTAAPLMTNRGAVANSNPGAAQPTPYGTVSEPPPVSPADRQHIVQPGETVASVALYYGYTEGRFREINGLGANEYLRIGQRLKVSDCNCPASSQPAATAAPTAYGQTGGNRVAAPTTYGQGGVVSPAPQAYQSPPAYGGGGTPVGPTATTVDTYRPPTSSVPAARSPSTAPSTYGSSAPATPQPYRQPRSVSPQPDAFDNSTSFGGPPPSQGQVIPEVYRNPAAGRSMNSLEGTGGSAVGRNSPSVGGNRIYTGGNDNTTYAAPNTRAVHVVQEGESLNSIARRYSLTVDQLRSFNNMQRTDVIIPFQRLYIN